VHFNRSTLAFIATLLLAAVLIWWVISRVDQQAATDAGPAGWQHADTPPSGKTIHDPWLDLADGWTEAAVPVATEIGHATRPGDGLEIFAVADGIVLFAGIRKGNHEVILGHRNADGTRFESIYTPLIETTRKPGNVIGRGMIVGRLGEAPLAPVFREAPVGIKTVETKKSLLAQTLESPDSEAWMTLEISNAEKMLELIEAPPTPQD